MLRSRSVQNHVSARESRLVILSVWLLACALLLPLETQAQTPATSTARELSNTFRSVAKQAVPAGQLTLHADRGSMARSCSGRRCEGPGARHDQV